MAYLDVVAVDTVVHRDKKEEYTESVYMLGDDTRAVRWQFTGNDFKIGDRAILFYKYKVEGPVEEVTAYDDGIQIDTYNGKYIVLPATFTISPFCKALCDKYEKFLNINQE